MQSFCLVDHISYCRYGREIVLIDTITDRYFLLGNNYRGVFRSIERGDAVPEADVEPLVRMGIIAPSGGESRAARTIPMPVCDQSHRLSRERSLGWKLMTYFKAIRCVASAHMKLRRATLNNIIADLAGTEIGPPLGRETLRKAEDVALIFCNMRRHMPRRSRCLPDSLALIDLLQREGIRATLVFGVKLDPFAAHCWVQLDQTVLNDSLDHALTFSIILAVQ